MKTLKNPDPAKPLNQKWVFLGILVIIAFGLWYQFHEFLTLDYLAQREGDLREFYQANPFMVYLLAFILYVTVAGLALPGAAALSLAYAWFFGFGRL